METVDRCGTQLHRKIAYGLIGVAFIVLFLIGGYGTAGDSGSYMSLGVYREPIYTLLVCGCRAIFGESGYALVLAVLQNLLSATACIVLVRMLDKYVFGSALMLVATTVVLLAPYVITPLLSRSHLVMTNKIMEEALTLPEYYLYIAMVVGIICVADKRRQYTLRAALMCTLMVLTRGQMSVAVIALGLLLILIGIRDEVMVRRSGIRLILQACVLVVVIMIGTSLLTRCYNYAVSGHFCGTASGDTTFATNVIYVSEQSSGDNIEDAQLRELYDDIYEALDEEQLLYDYAPASPLERAEYHEFCHDTIKYDYFEPIKNAVYEGLGDTYTDYLISQDKIASELTSALLPGCVGRWLSNYVCVCLLGFIRTVAVDKGPLWVYAAAVYLVYLILLIRHIRKHRLDDTSVLAIFAIVSVIGFVCGTAMYIMCLSRYVIYNLSLFYIVLLAMLEQLITRGRAVKNNE